MEKLKLRIKAIEPNGAVVMVPVETIRVEHISKKTKKVLTDAQVKKAKPEDLLRNVNRVHPSARLQFVPLEDDKTKYVEGDIYEVTMKKGKK